MPEISRFYGIVIKLHWRDHNPPHFHVEYGEQEAIIGIHTLAILQGNLPARALGMAIEWGELHRAELLELWTRAQARQELTKLPPLA